MGKRLLQINTVANWGSTGKIAEEIGKMAIEDGWESWIAYGRSITGKEPLSASKLIRIGNDWDIRLHGLESRLLDRHGLGSRKATRYFLKEVERIKPNIIHLHNIHGYYLNYKILFEWLAKTQIPVVWTLHDCWTMTGHCSHFDFIQCQKWTNGCHHCQQHREYPTSWLIDKSRQNWEDKKKAFCFPSHITLVAPSEWLNGLLSKSFLSRYTILTIHNGVDISSFKQDTESRNRIDEVYHTQGKKIILGVASLWTDKKGLSDFIELKNKLSKEQQIILVGLSANQIKNLPHGVMGIERTENVKQLADLYTSASCFVNPTLEDTFPTTNLEALACGTPVVTYDTGGSPEALRELGTEWGTVVPKRDIEALAKAIEDITSRPKPVITSSIREKLDKRQCFHAYLDLYNSLL